MAIKLEFINVVVALSRIREVLGEEYCEKLLSDFPDTCWHDDLLWRDGCMDEHVLSDMLDDWEKKGFQITETVDGKKRWKDVCVVYSSHGPSFPCDWIEYDKSKNVAWLKGHESGDAAGPAGREIHWNPDNA